MKYGLNIPAKGTLDLVALGALNHRVDSGIVPFSKATIWEVHPSGGEYNVAADLSDCFRLRTGMVSAIVDYPIGDLIAERVRAMGVKPFYKKFMHNGVNGPNMATVFSDQGYGVRAPVVFYNRSNEAAAQLKPGDFDWNGEDFLLSVLDTDAGSRTLGEFAIGTNNYIQKFTGNILFDEKIGGTIHLALGAAYPETGGVNKSAVHWDLICDTRDGTEITADGVPFYRNGEFLIK